MKHFILFVLFFPAACAVQQKAPAPVVEPGTFVATWRLPANGGMDTLVFYQHADMLIRKNAVLTFSPYDEWVKKLPCDHTWVAIEKDTIPYAQYGITFQVDSLYVHGKDLVCVKCAEQKKQLVYSPRILLRGGPVWISDTTILIKTPVKRKSHAIRKTNLHR